MMKEQIFLIKNKVFIIILFFVGLLIITLFASMLFIQKTTINDLAINQLKQQTTEKIAFFNYFVQHRIEMLQAITLNKDLVGFVKEGKNKGTIENLFLTQAKTHLEMFQLRYIDKTGQEIIRVDNYNEPQLIKNEKLQNKSARYYFVDTMKLDKGGIYFSNFDLNVENGKIDTAYIPTLRIATPIIIEGEQYGILIINVNLSELLNALQDMPLHSLSIIYGDGSIIIDKNSKYNWSRDFKSNTNIFMLYSFLPKDFNSYTRVENETFYLERLPINSKDIIYMLLTPKTFQKYSLLYDYIKEKLVIFLVFLIIGIIFSYIITRYIEKTFRNKIKIKEIKRNNQVIHSVMNSTNDLIYYKDANLNYIGANKAFKNFLDKKEHEIIGHDDFQLFTKEQAENFRDMDEKVLNTNKNVVNESWIRYPNGEQVYLEFKNMPFDYGSSDERYGVLTIAHDVTQRYKMNKRLQEESYKDALTGTFNRKAYNEKIDERIELFKRYEDMFCIAMIDIDNFKTINDTFGHDIGDKILIKLSQLINTLTRKSDILFRIGGEEFVILFPKTQIENAHIILEKIRKSVYEFPFIDDFDVSISSGLVEVLEHDSAESIYKRADILLYESKNSGKNKISIERSEKS